MRVLVLSLLLLGCAPAAEGPTLLYSADPQSLDNPFPDGRLVTGQGFTPRADWYRPFLPAKAQTGAMRSYLSTWAEDARELQGLGNFGPVLLRTSVPVDRATLPGAAVRLVREGDGYRVLERDVAIELFSDVYEGTGRAAPADFTDFLVVRPALPLPDGAQGLLVMLSGIRTADGQPLTRPRAFDERETIRAAASALGVKEDALLLALPQQGLRLLPTYDRLVDFAVNRYQPVVTVPRQKGTVPDANGDRPVGIYASTDADFGGFLERMEVHPWAKPATAVGQVVIGSFRAHDLRGPDGVWSQPYVDAPESSPTVEVAFALTLPKGPKPAGGYRAVIGAHGIGGRNTVRNGDPNSYCLEVAQLLAEKGLACIGIDAPSQGTRGSPVNFFALEHLSVTREHFREMIFDQLQLGTAIRQLDVDGDGQGDFAPELGYFGNSLGAIMGASYVSLDPRVKYALLNVPGGGLLNILNSPDIRDKIGLILASKVNITYDSPEYYGIFPLFRAIGQAFMEAGDPVNLGQAFPADRALLIQLGVNDLTIPNISTESLAKAMQAPEGFAAQTGAQGLKVLFRADPKRYLSAERAKDFNGHNLIWEPDAAPLRRQAQLFLESQGTRFVVE